VGEAVCIATDRVADVVIILIYLLAVSASIGTLFIAWDYIQGYASRHWPVCDGVIVQSKLAALPHNKKEQVPYIYYKYTVQGRDYYSRRLAMYVVQVFKNAQAEKMLETYPLGRQVTVSYHPLFRGLAVLEPGPSQLYTHLFLFLMFLLISVVSILAIVNPDLNLAFEALMFLTG